jgi:hypothetical protein
MRSFNVINEYQVTSIKYQEARAENQEIRLNSASLEVLPLAYFHVFHFFILQSAFGIRHWKNIKYLKLRVFFFLATEAHRKEAKCLSGLINFQFKILQSAFDIRVDPRNKNQEIRLNSAWLEILVLAFFNVSLLLHSSIGVQHSTLA